MRKKNVLCTTVTVDVMGPPDSSEKSIRTAEETVGSLGKEGNVLASKANTRYRYPGDEVIYKAIGETLRALRLESGMSIEQAEEAFREALAKTDYRATYRALGLTVRQRK